LFVVDVVLEFSTQFLFACAVCLSCFRVETACMLIRVGAESVFCVA
jgi:hypothetical protein